MARLGIRAARWIRFRNAGWGREGAIGWRRADSARNPRTPFAFASRLIIHLRESELKGLAKSKNVSGAVAKAAKQQLERKGVG